MVGTLRKRVENFVVVMASDIKLKNILLVGTLHPSSKPIKKQQTQFISSLDLSYLTSFIYDALDSKITTISGVGFHTSKLTVLFYTTWPVSIRCL